MTLKVWPFFFFRATLLSKMDSSVKIFVMGQRKRHHSEFWSCGIEAFVFSWSQLFGSWVNFLERHLFLIPSEGCVVKLFVSRGSSPSACGSSPSCLDHWSCSFYLLQGARAHCALSSLQPLPCVHVACAAVPVLLWNPFHPCSAGIPPHLPCHSGRACLGPMPGAFHWVSMLG